MGIFDKIKSVFQNGPVDGLEEELFVQVKQADQYIDAQLIASQPAWERIKALSDFEKVNLLLSVMQKRIEQNLSKRPDYTLTHLFGAVPALLLRTIKTLSDEDISRLAHGFVKYSYSDHPTFTYWPIQALVNKLKKDVSGQRLSDSLKATLKFIADDTNKWSDKYYEKERLKIVAAIDDLLYEPESQNHAKPEYFLGEDVLAQYANAQIKSFPDGQRERWFQILALAKKGSGAKPTAKFLSESKKCIGDMDSQEFLIPFNDWMRFIIGTKTQLIATPYEHGIFPICSVNAETFKGIVWISTNFDDSPTLRNLSAFAERCYQKIVNQGPGAAGLGNSCLYALSQCSSLEGVGHLSRLSLRVKQANTQTIITKYLVEAAQSRGMTVDTIEDLSVDACGMENGVARWELGDFTAEVALVGIGKTETRWFKKDGKVQKTVPAGVKENFAQELKEIKAIAKHAEITLTAQRDRIDRMFRSTRQMDWNHFMAYFMDHGVMSFLSKNIIWNFTENGKTHPAILVDGSWINHKGETILVSENAMVSLWHPAVSPVSETKAWREFLIGNQIRQPLKQAFREVYLLTEAELRTKSYSNRMAAHILKQHQFSQLAKMRGWKYSLIGSFDGGYEEFAQISLPDYGISAQFWINEVSDFDAMTDAGIWMYVATDQVRFVKSNPGEPDIVLDLVDVAPLAFSEMMRDVDLFVGVCSVGNDPQWQDNGGNAAHRDYWQSYSFGDLSEVAKTRKEILTGLVPRLKIKDVAEIKDKFLIVKGKLRTYKIHIGSTNILMEPNDEYLCIVPDRSAKPDSEKVFLPFEGDAGLSVLLSKAFLLADDDKIKDSTITSQINRK